MDILGPNEIYYSAPTFEVCKVVWMVWILKISCHMDGGTSDLFPKCPEAETRNHIIVNANFSNDDIPHYVDVHFSQL